MDAVLLRARADLRTRWRSWLALAVLVGLIGGAVTAAAAGARRTDSAFGRFLSATRSPDVLAFTTKPQPGFAVISYDTLARLPGVAGAASVGAASVVDPPDATLLASPDGQVGRTMLRHKMLAGRPPGPDRADEVMVSFTLASAHQLRVGSTLRLSIATAGKPGQPPVQRFSFRVVGIEASANEFPPQTGNGVNNAWASPAFYRTTAGTLGYFDAVVLRLRHGPAGVPAFEREIQRLSGGAPANVFALADQVVNTERSIHLQAVALWLLAGLLALAGTLVVAQLLFRQAQLESGDHANLRALGMGPGQLWAVGMTRAAFVGVVGAAVAVLVAAALSPLTPVGLARTAEPHPGLFVDPLAWGLAAAALLALVTAAAAWPAWRTAAVGAGTPSAPDSPRPSVLTNALRHAAAPVSVITGVRLALEPGRGRTAVPVRSTLVGTALGVVALGTALAFDASLAHLLATPRLYGVTWDAQLTALNGDPIDVVLPTARQDHDVTAISAGYAGFPAEIGALRVDGIAVSAVRGPTLMPTAIHGRLPAAPDEAVLGSRTMASVHAHIGSTIELRIADASPQAATVRVVGQAVFPTLSDAMGLGKGIGLTPAALHRLVPGDAVPPPNTVLVRFRPGMDPARGLAALQRRVSKLGSFAALAPQQPVDLVNFGRVQSLPLVLSGLLGSFAAATMVHLLVTSIRRRRRDLAILKILGLAPGQVRATVAWQSTTLALVAVVVGVPLGVVAGRSVWLFFADQLGIVAEPVVPLAALALLVLAAVLVANLIAVLPGRIAARTSPALVLRTE